MSPKMTKDLLPLLLIMQLFFSVPLIKASIFSYPKYYVNILNDILPENSSQFNVHCASKNDEIGHFTLYHSQDIQWKFRVNYWGTTLFFCHFWWGRYQRSFEVFNTKWEDLCKSEGSDKPNLCHWVVKNDGFYLTNKESYGPPDLVREYAWES